MVRIAKKDTYGIETVGGGAKVRRIVAAGTAVPDHYEVSSGDVEEVKEGPSPLTGPTVEEAEPKAEPKAAAPKREPRRRS